MGHKRQHHRKDNHDGDDARRPRRRDDDIDEFGDEFVDYADFDFDAVDRTGLEARFERQRRTPGHKADMDYDEVLPSESDNWGDLDNEDWEDYTEAG
ncbi:MAG: hypothetical protein H6830_11025 [Planctomycetes bacterium]|nr:hypothetical protein [Planctomycetota bacterium]HPF15734.1 hypothetical protein [Planctomycetota bacterium]HRV81263.1 hypothetical protein [Planctomycetota bacterium]